MEGKVVDFIPEKIDRWKYKQIYDLLPGKSILYEWDLFKNVPDPWSNMRTVAWVYGRKLNWKLRAFKRKEGIYISRIE